MQAIETQMMTADTFLELVNAPENAEKRLELIDGEVIEMPSSSKKNAVIASLFVIHLGAHVLPLDLGYVTGADGGFRVNLYNVPQPDAAFIPKARVSDLEGITFEGAPDLAVEVISPSETRSQIRRKTQLYLENGAELVWLVYPDEEFVTVCFLNEAGEILSKDVEKDGVLEGGSALPDFKLPLSQIFRD